MARVKSKKNDTKEEKYMLLTLVLHFTFRPCYTGLSVHFLKHLCFYFRFQLQNVFNLDSDNRAEDTPTLIDRKVWVFHFPYFFCVRSSFCAQGW